MFIIYESSWKKLKKRVKLYINIDQRELEYNINIRQSKIQNKENHQGSIHKEDFTTLNGYACNNRASEYMKQTGRTRRRNVVRNFKTFR